MEQTRAKPMSTKPMTFSQRMKKWMAVVDTVTAYIGAASVVFMIVAPCVDVFSRYLLGRPLIWVDEFTEYALVLCTFLPAAWVLSLNGHVTIDIVVALVDDRKRRVFTAISYFVGLFYCLLCLWLGGEYALEALSTGARFDSMMSVPKFPILVIIPIGFGLLCLEFIAKILTHFFPAPQEEKEESI